MRNYHISWKCDFIFYVFLYALYTLPTKLCIVKAMDFPVMMYGCESWTIKKVEC